MEMTDKQATPDIVHAFEAYCRKAIDNAVKDYERRKIKRSNEILVPDFWENEIPHLKRVDTYPIEMTVFSIGDHSVSIRDDALAESLGSLPERSRNIVLLYYFLSMTDSEVGQTLNMNGRTVNDIRRKAVNSLREKLGVSFNND